ncbi:nucleotidyltransferase family protein [Bacillus sp. T33-2]|uniref:nucleotidyltransferase family protein n=1 Tax=Bacillus sp. T33-2 TaxID=2054168 RepID=UPI0015E0F942|nr:nucleotidyltransferase family protein [Bacillus sp. T33-2]
MAAERFANTVYKKDLYQELITIIEQSDHLKQIFSAAGTEFGDYYVGAGCLVQTVWNHLSGYPLEHGIGDVDIVYFDSADLSAESERLCEQRIAEKLGKIPYKVDVKNEARVHLWYEDKFGYKISPYTSLEGAVNTWPTTATALGVKKTIGGDYEIYAPYGLNDLFGMIVRPNKVQITKKIYEKKARKWAALWPELTIVPWDE